MAPRPCLECGVPTLKTRCAPCATQRERERTAARGPRPHYEADWPRVSREIRGAWVEANGWWCPGWQRSPHASTDLVVDHVIPRSRAQLAVLCRSCNGRKSATERRTGAGRA